MEKNYKVVFKNPDEVALELSEAPEPAEDEVLIKSNVTCISTGTELSVLMSSEQSKGTVWDRMSSFPRYPGYNNIGRVVKAGGKADENLVGKRVSSRCGHASYGVAKADQVMVVPDGIEDRHAVLFNFALIVFNGVRRGGLNFGESAAVYGAGILGQIAARLCKICGAYPVIVLETSDYRLSRVPDDECFVKINPGKDDVLKMVGDATRGRMCDAVFELTGNPGIIPEEFKILRKQGKFVVISSPRGDTVFNFHDLCNNPSYHIIGAHNNSHPPSATLNNPWDKKRDEELFYDYLSIGSMGVEELISHREPYTEAVKLYRMLMEDRSAAMGVILSW